MNKKQLVCLWIGIIIFAFVGLTTQIGFSKWTLAGNSVGDAIVTISKLLVNWVVILIITSGLIYTFRDKKTRSQTTSKTNK